MEVLPLVLQVIVALGLLNVWLVRAGQATPYRGGAAKSIREEFAAYGLPVGVMWLVGILKISIAVTLILGIWIPSLVAPAASGLVVLMVGAVVMHVKVKDPMMKSMPAAAMLALAIALLML